MKFVVNKAYSNRQNRKLISISAFLLLVAVALVAMLFRVQKLTDLFFPIVGIYFIATATWAMFKKIKRGVASYAVVNVDETAEVLSVSFDEATVSLPLNQLTNLRLQYKSGSLQSVVTDTNAMGRVRFEGYDQLELLAEILKKYVPIENIKTASFFHR